MSTTTQAVADVLKAAQNELGRKKIQQLALPLQDYVAMPNLLQKERMMIKGGTGVTRTLMVDHSGAAREVEQFEPDAVGFKDVLKTISQDYRITQTSYVVGDGEIAMCNGDETQVVDLVRVRRDDAMISLIEKMENRFWSAGPATVSDKKTPMGIWYWLLKGTGGTYATTGALNTAAPTGHTAGRGGLLHARHGNWAAQYTNFTRDDVITKMKRAFRETKFKNPLKNPMPDHSRGAQRRAIYMNWTTKESLELIGESRNENVGYDLAFKGDEMTFKGIALTDVPQLDSDTTNPIVFLDWSTFYFIALKGMWMKETIKPMWPSHDAASTFIDFWWNTLCVELRKNAVLAQ